MEENTKKFTKWLDNLQQESWQLELLVSGFVIFGLFQALAPVKDFFSLNNFSASGGIALAFLTGVVGFSVIVSMHLLLFNLLVHLVLRGLWIGAVGLRYYSGDIDYENLRYSEKFQKYLKKKIGSFDQYIKRLEDYCSIIFSLSFLLVFIFLSFSVILSILLLPATTLSQGENVMIGHKIFIVSITFLFLFMVILTVIDFLGQGILKKNKIIGKLYFPIYWIMSYLSLSFLYRPILYNFLDHKKGRRILFWLFPFYIGISLLSTLSIKQSNFHAFKYEDSASFIQNSEYLNQLTNEENFNFDDVAIGAKTIFKPALRVFLAHSKNIEDAIVAKSTMLTLDEDQRGIYSEVFMSRSSLLEKGSMLVFEEYLNTLNENVSIEIDSKSYNRYFLATTLTNKQKGYETFLNLKGLDNGKHTLLFKSKLNAKAKEDTLAIIPFWYFGD